MITRRPGRGIPARVLNPLIGVIVGRLGLPLAGLRILRVHGRRTGQLHTVPVAVARTAGARYLVSPRGATDWSLNLRSAGWCELMRGRRSERVRATTVEGREREEAVGAYLASYGWATRRLLGTPRRPSQADIAAAAATRPVFRLSTWEPARRGTGRSS